MCEAKNMKKYEAITVQRCYLFSLKEILSVNIIFKISHWLQATIMKKLNKYLEKFSIKPIFNCNLRAQRQNYQLMKLQCLMKIYLRIELRKLLDILITRMKMMF